MADLIEDILAYSRIGRAAVERAPVDMNAVVRVVTQVLQPAIGERTVHFRIAELPPAHGDAAMLERVWTNILDNAVKYTRRKSEAIIEVGATASDTETTYFVRDNGAGFDMKYVDKLFGVFQRLHGAEFEGNGIGLAIVKRIVTRLGGRVYAEGKPDEGATFYFSLPKSVIESKALQEGEIR
jgi:light-regulated signal transduction histidine kinase (bacteriophytochrome)